MIPDMFQWFTQDIQSPFGVSVDAHGVCVIGRDDDQSLVKFADIFQEFDGSLEILMQKIILLMHLHIYSTWKE